MGLNAKRAVESFKQNEFPAFLQELNKVVGAEIPVEVKWDSLATQLEGNNFSELEQYHERMKGYFHQIFAKTVLEAFKELSGEGVPLTEVLKGRVNKLIFCNESNCFEPEQGIKLTEGVLILDLTCSNTDNYFSGGRIQALKQVIKTAVM